MILISYHNTIVTIIPTHSLTSREVLSTLPSEDEPIPSALYQRGDFHITGENPDEDCVVHLSLHTIVSDFTPYTLVRILPSLLNSTPLLIDITINKILIQISKDLTHEWFRLGYNGLHYYHEPTLKVFIPCISDEMEYLLFVPHQHITDGNTVCNPRSRLPHTLPYPLSTLLTPYQHITTPYVSPHCILPDNVP